MAASELSGNTNTFAPVQRNVAGLRALAQADSAPAPVKAINEEDKITPVTTVEELQQALKAQKRNIEIREHLDLGPLYNEAGWQTGRAVLDGINSIGGDGTGSLRVRCYFLLLACLCASQHFGATCTVQTNRKKSHALPVYAAICLSSTMVKVAFTNGTV